MTSERCLTTSKGPLVFSMYDYLNEIKIRPALWDKDHVNRINRFMDWDDVVRSLVPYFDDLPLEEQKDLNSKMLKLWKHTTNLLMKSLKIKNNGDPKYRPYIYAHPMEFYLNNRGITLDEVGTPEEFEENDKLERKHWENKNNLMAKYTTAKELINHYQEEQDDSNYITPDDSRYDPMLFCETTTQDGVNTTTYDYGPPAGVANNFESDNVAEQEDPDQDFMDSIKPFLNKLNNAQILNFKIEFLQILKKYHSQNV